MALPTAVGATPVPRKPNSSKKPSAGEIDRFVGTRIRERRITLGLTQQELAERIGVTYQQAHKYERGINRISAGRLYNIAAALEVQVAYFFEGIDNPVRSNFSQRQRMCLELARNFTHITNQRHQEALSHLARALAGEDQQES
ncbi:helix-turn-helix domain-containing protein [Oceanibacterium hippocampi]|uniref:Anaerobic benzoate catabolism transcriptional regulator n=1 Tax=Oceanibacterium hippocampi TaxID=745714 RepID=A0A1Y5S6A0_9PROT|nr:helix-turn-helix domain-containing protein [Oceanibacterium hippocampi]SLN32610.1 anaerobic benzoate catabolism transcriptional regulator [Oceanibacterium hippocampi]